MRLWEIFRYDVATQLRRPSATLYGGGLVAMTLLVLSTFLDDARRDGILLDAPLVIGAAIVFVTMAGLLVVAAIAAEAATRDANARMEALLYATPLAKLTYLAGRFLSAFAVSALLFAIVPLTMAAGALVPGTDPAWFGGSGPAPYLVAYLTVALPNAFIITALLFSLVTLSRRAMAGYLGAAALFFNTMIQDEVFATALGRWDIAKRFDLFGFMVLRAQWRSSTVLQRNTLPLQLDGDLLANRLLWIAISLVALTLVFARFRMAHHATTSGARWWRRRAVLEERDVAITNFTPPAIRGTFDRSTRVRQLFAIALHAYREMIASRAAWLLPLLGLLLFQLVPQLMEVALGTPGRPATARMVAFFLKFDTFRILAGALIAYFAGHLVWRDRDAREHEIGGVLPVPDALSFAGRLCGLALLLVTMQAVQLAAAIATQLNAGYDDIEPGLYLTVLFGVQLTDFVLFAILAIAIQLLVNHKYLGMAIVLLVWLYGDHASALGIEHHLLVFGSDPGVRYSDMSGFGASLGPWLWFKAYWLGWALLLASLARRRCTRGVRVMTGVAVALIAIAGGVIFYNTNVRNEYTSAADAARRSAEYERRYGQDAHLPQPLIAATKLRVELTPSQGRAEIDGTYRLENRSGGAIGAIHLVTHRTIPTTSIAFDRAARATLNDEELGYRIFTLAEPLAPGASLQLNFHVSIARRGFTNDGISSAVTENGTLLEHGPDASGRSWLPAVGHQTGLERIDLDTTIGTDGDQIAVAPGTLQRSWTERGRRYFHYVTDAPIRNGYPILSARYAVHRSRVNGVDVEVLHHPKHAWNVERFARAARASLAYHAREFGAYPLRQLRLVEFPSTGGNRMTSHPGTIVWSESFAYARPEEDRREIDFPFAVVAHEVAHQWWGNQVVPARVEGAPLVSESLAWYSALNVVQETLGDSVFDRTMAVMRESYLKPNATPTVPLLRANDWLAVYRTGALAMHSLREAVGSERVNVALRQLVTEHRDGRAPFATSLELYHRLRAVTPAETRPLLHDLFAAITYWDLRMKSAEAEPLVRGAYRVTMQVEAYKVRVGDGGRQTRVPMNDAVEIAVFDEEGAVLDRRVHRIRSGEQTVSVEVPRAPARAAIDAAHKLLDRRREDDATSFARRE